MATQKRTAVITLEGVDYTIHAFNIGELEQLAEIMSGPSTKVPFGIMRLALARAEPKIADVAAIEPTSDELSAAVEQITGLAGLKKSENPPQAAN